MTVQVSAQTSYVPMTTQGQVVSSQSVYISMFPPPTAVSTQTVYVALLNDGGTATRRRNACMVL